jgi:hypothetical protein
MDAVARLIAIEEIKQLKSRYFRTMDTRDWDGMAGVFCRDAILDTSGAFQYTPLGGKPVGPLGPVLRGRDAIMAWISSGFVDQSSAHHGHGHEITIDSETEAHGIVAMEDVIREPDRQTIVLHGYGYYHERYRFEDDAWRIGETRIDRLFTDLMTTKFDEAVPDDPALPLETAPDA